MSIIEPFWRAKRHVGPPSRLLRGGMATLAPGSARDHVFKKAISILGKHLRNYMLLRAGGARNFLVSVYRKMQKCDSMKVNLDIPVPKSGGAS